MSSLTITVTAELNGSEVKCFMGTLMIDSDVAGHTLLLL